MPEETEVLNYQYPTYEWAKNAVASLLESLGTAPPQPLSDGDLQAYKDRQITAGWRLLVEFEDGVRHLDVLLQQGFPWQPVRIALVDRPEFLTWPHVERDGVLCLTSDTVEIDPNDPAGATACLLSDAVDLISELIKGNLSENFQDEILSYWSFSADKTSSHFVSLLSDSSKSRTVRAWRGKAEYVLAEADSDLRQWLQHRYGKDASDFKFEDAALICLRSPLKPSSYPETGNDLRALVRNADAASSDILLELVRQQKEKIVVTLAVITSHGRAYTGLVAEKPKSGSFSKADQLTKGFRPGNVPSGILLTRYLGGSRVSRRSVVRADAGWIHGRDKDPNAAGLRSKTVLVFGCGSVGSSIATHLAQAGVGQLILVDPDILQWANISRHSLGASKVGKNKAEALATSLCSDLPHINAKGYALDVEMFLSKHGDLAEAADLIISATGSWRADARLDAWQHSTPSFQPVLYGWLEAHACAGHAVLIAKDSDCLLAGFDNTGLPDFSIADWSQGSTTHREPGCGAVFQPYGPIELSTINSVISELALEFLVEESMETTHRIWVGTQKRLRTAGGNWSASWKDDPNFRPEGGFIVSKPWPHKDSSTRATA